MKTIKQIADELGVSKQAIRNAIAKLGLQTALRKNGNSFAIDKHQEALIKADFLKESQNKTQSGLQSESQSSLQSALRLLERQNEQLSGELSAKNKLIDEQQQTIKKLADALVTAQQTTQAAQILHATEKPHLAASNSEAMATDAPPEPTVSQPGAWGVFSRIFGRKQS